MEFKFNGKFKIAGRGDGDWQCEVKMDSDEFIRSCDQVEKLLPTIQRNIDRVLDQQDRHFQQEMDFKDDRKKLRKKLDKADEKLWETQNVVSRLRCRLIDAGVDPDTLKPFGGEEKEEDDVVDLDRD